MMTDTTREIEEMQNELWMRKTPQERARFASAMFAAGRKAVIASLSKNLSKTETIKQLYFRTYGENLPKIFSKINICRIDLLRFCVLKIPASL